MGRFYSSVSRKELSPSLDVEIRESRCVGVVVILNLICSLREWA